MHKPIDIPDPCEMCIYGTPNGCRYDGECYNYSGWLPRNHNCPLPSKESLALAATPLYQLLIKYGIPTDKIVVSLDGVDWFRQAQKADPIP